MYCIIATPLSRQRAELSNEKRENIVKRMLITDKNFKLTSLKVNPLYKPVFDKLDAIALKKLNELDKSILWSRGEELTASTYLNLVYFVF